MEPKELFYVFVRSADSLLYEGNVKAITASNADGTFDILPMHANFISIVNGTVTVTESGDVKKEFPIGMGVIKVRNNKVAVLIGITNENDSISAL